MMRLRTGLALMGLVVLGGLVAASALRPFALRPMPGDLMAGVIVALLGLTGLGLVRGSDPARWLALAVGLAVLPWATVLTVLPSYGAPRTPQMVALLASLLLVTVPHGGTGEGSPRRPDGARRAAVWLRWCIILNTVSTLELALFVGAYRTLGGAHVIYLAAPLAVLAVGMVLLLREKTLGLLLVALGSVLLIPAGTLFVVREVSSAGEAAFFGLLFAPGAVAAAGLLMSCRRPLVRLLAGAPSPPRT